MCTMVRCNQYLSHFKGSRLKQLHWKPDLRTQNEIYYCCLIRMGPVPACIVADRLGNLCCTLPTNAQAQTLFCYDIDNPLIVINNL